MLCVYDPETPFLDLCRTFPDHFGSPRTLSDLLRTLCLEIPKVVKIPQNAVCIPLLITVGCCLDYTPGPIPGNIVHCSPVCTAAGRGGRRRASAKGAGAVDFVELVECVGCVGRVGLVGARAGLSVRAPGWDGGWLGKRGVSAHFWGRFCSIRVFMCIVHVFT